MAGQQKQTQEQDINHLLKVRREKLQELQENGKNPFEITKYDVTHHSQEIKDRYEELEEKEVTATAGGGAVEVTVSGKHEVTKIKLSEEVVDPDDIEMLEDLIMAATNEAFRKLDEESQSSMAKITGGMGGLGGLPF